MKMHLLCPECGFAFGILCPDDLSEEEVREIMTCPCGAMMVRTGALYGNPVREEDEDDRMV